MRILDSHLLNDGRLFNDGRAVKLIEIQETADIDRLLDNILNSGYYSDDYFKRNLSHPSGQLKYENLALAEMAHVLNPGSLLELGCGRGDILCLLNLAGHQEICGIDLSKDAAQSASPDLQGKILTGDLLDLLNQLAGEGRRFDTILGFDIWEHLHPVRLTAHVDAVKRIASADALMLFIIPAYGQDRVFGELFPLELEENRSALSEHRPFSYLLAEKVDPPIPAQGHLIWADSQWWEEQFQAGGLRRSVEVEAGLHQLFDPYLWRAQRSFFVLAPETQAVSERMDRLCKYHLDLLYLWRTKLHFLRVLEKQRATSGRELVPIDNLVAALDDAGVRLQDCHMSQSAQLWGKIRELEGEDCRLHDGVAYLRQLVFPLIWLRKLLALCVPQVIRDRLNKAFGRH